MQHDSRIARLGARLAMACIFATLIASFACVVSGALTFAGVWGPPLSIQFVAGCAIVAGFVGLLDPLGFGGPRSAFARGGYVGSAPPVDADRRFGEGGPEPQAWTFEQVSEFRQWWRRNMESEGFRIAAPPVEIAGDEQRHVICVCPDCVAPRAEPGKQRAVPPRRNPTAPPAGGGRYSPPYPDAAADPFFAVGVNRPPEAP